jgi:retron-type reverse transcriptase
LERLIGVHFEESRLINLYWKIVKAGYIDWDTSNHKFIATELGVPQGGIISPVLSNLVLHELDKHMQKLVEEREAINGRLKQSVTNPEYHKLTMQISRLNKKIQLEEKPTGLRKERASVLSERRKLKSLIPNPEVVRYKYIRYADD